MPSNNAHYPVHTARQHQALPPSRLPIPTSQLIRKRPILGERFDNHLITPSSKPTTISKPLQPGSTPRVHFTASSPKTKPKQRQSFAGHTPHPVRLSLGNVRDDQDVTLLFDVKIPDFGSEMSSPMRSEIEDSPRRGGRGRAVLGEGRLMTPAESQEMPVKQTLPFAQATPSRYNTTTQTRLPLPTPPSSQSNDLPTPKTSRIRPRATPTPPRRTPQHLPLSIIEFEIPLRQPTEEISPNPRRKKSPRVDPRNGTTSPCRSQFTFEIVLPSSRSKSSSPPVSNTKGTKGKGRGRAARISTISRTPSSTPQLNASSSSTSSSITTTSDPTRRKSLALSRLSSASTFTPNKPPSKPRSRQSLPAKNSRLSLAQTPANKSTRRKPPATTSKLHSESRRKSSVGVVVGKGNVVLDEVLEPDSDSDDPLLLKGLEREELKSWRRGLERRLGLIGGKGKGKGKGEEGDVGADGSGRESARQIEGAEARDLETAHDDAGAGGGSTPSEVTPRDGWENAPPEEDIPSPFLKSSSLPISQTSPPFASQSTFEDQTDDLTLDGFDASNDYDPPMDWASDDGSDDGGGVGDNTFVHVLARRGLDGPDGEVDTLRLGTTAGTGLIADGVSDEDVDASAPQSQPATPFATRRAPLERHAQPTSSIPIDNEHVETSPASTVISNWVKSPRQDCLGTASPSPTRTSDRHQRTIRGPSVLSVYLDCSDSPKGYDAEECAGSPTPVRRSRSATPNVRMDTSPVLETARAAVSLTVPSLSSLGLRVSGSPSPRISRLSYTVSTPKAKIVASLHGSPTLTVVGSPSGLKTVDSAPATSLRSKQSPSAPTRAMLFDYLPPSTLTTTVYSAIVPLDEPLLLSDHATGEPSSASLHRPSMSKVLAIPSSTNTTDSASGLDTPLLHGSEMFEDAVALGDEEMDDEIEGDLTVEAESGEWDDIVTPVIPLREELAGDKVIDDAARKIVSDLVNVGSVDKGDSTVGVEKVIIESEVIIPVSQDVGAFQGERGGVVVGQSSKGEMFADFVAQQDIANNMEGDVGGYATELSIYVQEETIGLDAASLEVERDASVQPDDLSAADHQERDEEGNAGNRLVQEKVMDGMVGSEDGDITAEGAENDWNGSVSVDSGSDHSDVNQAISELAHEEVYEPVDSEQVDSEIIESSIEVRGRDIGYGRASTDRELTGENLMVEAITFDVPVSTEEVVSRGLLRAEEEYEHTDGKTEKEAAQEEELPSRESILPPRELEERIVVNIVDLGRIVKLEPDLNSDAPSTTPSSSPILSGIPAPISPREVSTQASDIRETPPVESDIPTSQAAQSPKTPSIYPSLPHHLLNTPSASQPATNPSSSGDQSTASSLYTQQRSTPINRNDETVHTLGTMLQRRNSSSSSTGPSTTLRPSRLSNEVLPSPPHARPVSRRSLGAELRNAIMAEGGDAGREALTSIVEVSSLDPKAAARAAAILKLNHAYIEHGSLPTPRPTGSKVDRQELLLEAELDLVKSRRSRSRSRSVAVVRGHAVVVEEEEDEEDEGYVPGGWKATPGKRKRARMIRQENVSKAKGSATIAAEGQEEKEGRAWGVAEWKRLERAYRAEKEDWVKEREVKNLPGMGSQGWITFRWGKKGDAEIEAKGNAKEWEAGRVVERFCEGHQTEELVGEWDKEIIRLRVEALEERVAHHRLPKTPRIGDQPVSKKVRVEESGAGPVTPLRWGGGGVVPPSTIQRMLGFVWSDKPSGSVIATAGEETETRGKAQGNKLLDRLMDVRRVEGRSLGGEKREVTRLEDPRKGVQPGGTGMINAITPMSAPPKSVAQSATKPPPQSTTTATNTSINSNAYASSSTSLISSSRPSGLETPLTARQPGSSAMTLSTTAATYTSRSELVQSTSSSVNAPVPSLAQRTAAIRALFPGTPMSSPSTTPISIPSRGGLKESPSVKDLVRSFEDGGVLARSMDKGKGKGLGDALRKVQSRGV